MRYTNLQRVAQHCFVASFGSMFRVFHLGWSTCRATKTFVAGWRELLQNVERGSTFSNNFKLFCSFFNKLTTCHATNLLMLRDRLKVFVSRISPPLWDFDDHVKSRGLVVPRFYSLSSFKVCLELVKKIKFQLFKSSFHQVLNKHLGDCWDRSLAKAIGHGWYYHVINWCRRILHRATLSPRWRR